MQDTTSEKSEIFIMPFLVTLSLSGIFFALLYMFYYKTQTVHWYMLSAVGAAWLYIPIKKITKNYNLYANWLVLCCLYGVGYTSYLMGSLNSASVWWLIFIPILAAFFLDLIQTFIWSLIALSAVALLTLSHLKAFDWLTYTNELRTDNPTLAISLSLFTIISCAAALILYLRAIIDKLESQKESLIEESYIHASTQSLGELASGIAHEVNNPLAIIKGHANYLESKTETLDLDPDTKKSLISHIQRIDASTNNASSTVRSLGYLTRGINLEKPEIFKINEVLEVVRELNSKKFLLKNIELKIDASEKEQNFKVYASKGQVIQVLINLLNNSFDAIQNNMGSWVKMSYEVSKDKDFILLRVIDSGIGINIKDRHSIFKPLYTTKEVGSGQGLGLSLAKTIMKKNNGDLYLDHTAHNTTFVIKLSYVK